MNTSQTTTPIPTDRQEQIAWVFANPPHVHDVGVWNSTRSCYEYLATVCEPGVRTLETGLGISTVLFAIWGTEHTCVVPSTDEVERCLAFCAKHGIDTTKITFETAPSDAALPGMQVGSLDVLLIDGGHGWPIPVIDWYYGARWLRRGGIVIVDDVQLPHVSNSLVDFLRRDPRWKLERRTRHWAAFRRLSEGELGEEWTSQPFVYRRGTQHFMMFYSLTMRPAVGRLLRRLKLLERP